jgi:hypothetical protein
MKEGEAGLAKEKFPGPVGPLLSSTGPFGPSAKFLILTRIISSVLILIAVTAAVAVAVVGVVVVAVVVVVVVVPIRIGTRC